MPTNPTEGSKRRNVAYFLVRQSRHGRTKSNNGCSLRGATTARLGNKGGTNGTFTCLLRVLLQSSTPDANRSLRTFLRGALLSSPEAESSHQHPGSFWGSHADS